MEVAEMAVAEKEEEEMVEGVKEEGVGEEGKRGELEMVGEVMEVAEMAVEEKEGVGKSWKQPEATHIVMYKRQETGTKHLNGRVACKLTGTPRPTITAAMSGGCCSSQSRSD